MQVDLDPPVGTQTTVTMHREYRYEQIHFTWTWKAPDPGNEHDRIELLRTCAATGDVEWRTHVRPGRTDGPCMNDMDSLASTIMSTICLGRSHTAAASFTTGRRRHEYTVMLPITDPPVAPANPVLKFYNFFPLSAAGGSAVLNLDETNTDLFLNRLGAELSDQDTIGLLATEIGLAFQPLNSAFQSPDSFAAFMETLGWNMDSVPAALSSLSAPAAQIGTIVQDGEVDSGEVPQLLAAIVGFVGAVNGIASQPAGNFPAGLDVAAFKSEFPQQLIDYLIIDYLLRRLGGWGNLVKLAGIVRLEDVPASASRPAFTRRTVAWADLGQFFSDPTLVLRNAYNWGQADFQDVALLQNVADVLDGWHVNSRFAAIDPAMFTSLTAGALNPDNVFQAALQVPFFEQLVSGFGGEVGLELFILPQTAAKFSGFAILPYADGDIEEDIPLTDNVSLRCGGKCRWQAASRSCSGRMTR